MLIQVLEQKQQLTHSMHTSLEILLLSYVKIEEKIEQSSESNPFLERAESYIPFTGSYQQNNTPPEITADPPSLWEYLRQQIHQNIDSRQDRSIAYAILESLDETGYVSDFVLEEMAKKHTIPYDRVIKVLQLCQKCEPTGVFSRNLNECLSLQLKERGLMNEAYAILLNQLDLLANKNYEKLRLLCKISSEELKTMIRTIKSLTPKPCENYSHRPPLLQVPDAIFCYTKEKGWSIHINSPKVSLINQDLYKMARKTEEIRMHYQEAAILTYAIRAREQSLLKVCSWLLKKHQDFFEQKTPYLTQLTMRTVSEDLQMHESTISRIVKNKWILTPFRTFELKYFFSSSPEKDKKDSPISSNSIKEQIKQLIASEGKSQLFHSDESIRQHFLKQNIEVARRTVTKYRQAMNIPAAAERKKKLGRQ